MCCDKSVNKISITHVIRNKFSDHPNGNMLLPYRPIHPCISNFNFQARNVNVAVFQTIERRSFQNKWNYKMKPGHLESLGTSDGNHIVEAKCDNTINCSSYERHMPLYAPWIPGRVRTCTRGQSVHQFPQMPILMAVHSSSLTRQTQFLKHHSRGSDEVLMTCFLEYFDFAALASTHNRAHADSHVAISFPITTPRQPSLSGSPILQPLVSRLPLKLALPLLSCGVKCHPKQIWTTVQRCLGI